MLQFIGQIIRRRFVNTLTSDILVVLLISTMTQALLAFFGTYSTYKSPTYSLILLASTLVPILALLPVYQKGLIYSTKLLLSLAFQSVCLILVFGAIYRGAGLISTGTTAEPIDGTTALYFSVVTWTTLGYGDFHPAGVFKLFAAAEALIGYLYLGLIVGLAAALISQLNEERVRTTRRRVSPRKAPRLNK
jgi:hypothetical protein